MTTPTDTTQTPRGALKSVVFRREREAAWRQFEHLLGKVEKTGLRSLDQDELIRLPNLYRATLSSLSVARVISLDRNLVGYLENLATRGYFSVYGARAKTTSLVAEFFAVRLPAAVRGALKPILLSALIFAFAAAVGFGFTTANQDWYYAFISESMAQGRTPDASTADLRAILFNEDHARNLLDIFAAHLFSNNAGIGMLSFAVGLFFGVPTVLILLSNGAILGAMAALYASRGLSLELWGWLLIHGTTELLALILCGAAGLMLGGALAFPGRHTRLENLARTGRTAAVIVIGCVVMFFIAGLLEGFGRQEINSTLIRYLIAGAMLVFWLGYFAFAGARHGADSDSR